MVHHRRGLRRLLKDDDQLARIEQDWTNAGLDQRRTAILEYAVLLTNQPGDVAESNVEQLRSVGLTDRDILDVCEVVGYYAYVNRIADGLGVDLEDWLPDD
ncbi:MAG: peroxidase [bacterium]|nr:peroxidase [bacterium]MCP4963849.1 peroxidase [bacterium]